MILLKLAGRKHEHYIILLATCDFIYLCFIFYSLFIYFDVGFNEVCFQHLLPYQKETICCKYLEPQLNNLLLT